MHVLTQDAGVALRNRGDEIGVMSQSDGRYRLVDRIVTLYLLSMIYRVISSRRPHWVPKFARKSAMGVDVVFR